MKRQGKSQGKSKRVPPEIAHDGLPGAARLHVQYRPDPLFAPPPPIIDTVLFSRVGHTFKKHVQPFGPPLYLVQDFLLDQTGTSGGDGKMSALKSFDLTTAVSYRINVFPKDRSKVIKVLPPPGGSLYFAFNAGRRFVNPVSDYSDAYPANTYFINLQGPAPAFTYNWFFIGHNTNHWIHTWVNADVHAPMAFNGFTTFGIYPARSFDPGLKSYGPLSYGLPFNLAPWPTSVPYLMFGYATTDPVDPGPCVSLV